MNTRVLSDWGLALVGLAALAVPLTLRAVTPEIQGAARSATFEVVLKKPAAAHVEYKRPLPLDLLPFTQRNDPYESIGTAFAVESNQFVSAAHVFLASAGSEFGAPAIRDSTGRIFPITTIRKFSFHEDFIVFTVDGLAAGSSFVTSRETRLDAPVLAVGNALGEGVVIREGLLTSETPEEQDGRWKWLRFSAAASPGNSGGPLLNEQGGVIGIVIGKSPNENLNYALPIGRVLDAPDDVATFDSRSAAQVPFLRERSTVSMKQQFALPRSWGQFEVETLRVLNDFAVDSTNKVLTTYRVADWPGSPGGVRFLRDAPLSYFPRVVAQGPNDSWGAEEPHTEVVALAGDGFIEVSAFGVMQLFRIHQPESVPGAAKHADSKAFLDLVLKGVEIVRIVGPDAIQVTSLGKAQQEAQIVDRYGRKWQWRAWAAGYYPGFVVTLALATPDGYVGIVQQLPSMSLPSSKDMMRILADQIHFAYWGTIEQWQAFLAHDEILPTTLQGAAISVGENGPWRLETQDLALEVPEAALPVTPRSELGVGMTFVPHREGVSWRPGYLGCFIDREQKTYLEIRRYPRPATDAGSVASEQWAQLTEGRGQFDGVAHLDIQKRAFWVSAAVRGSPAAQDVRYVVTLATDQRVTPTELEELHSDVVSQLRLKRP